MTDKRADVGTDFLGALRTRVLSVTVAPLLANLFLLATNERQGYHDKLTHAVVAQE